MIFPEPKKWQKRWLRELELGRINTLSNTHLDHTQEKEEPKTPHFSPLRQKKIPLADARDTEKVSASPEGEQRKARAIGEADKPVSRVSSRSNGSTPDSPVVWGGMKRIEEHLRSRKQLADKASMSRESDDNLRRQAGLSEKLGKYGESEELYKFVLAIFDEEFGRDHPDVATILQDLADAYYKQKKNGETDPLEGRALTIYDEKLGPDHPDVAKTLSHLADSFYGQKEHDMAEILYNCVIKIFEQKLGPAHPESIRIRNIIENYYKVPDTERLQGSEASSLIDRNLLNEDRESDRRSGRD